MTNRGSNALEQFLRTPTVLWWSGSMYLLLTIGFVAVMLIWDFQLIDELYRRHDILAGVAKLDQTQRQVHIVTTATLDVLYPFAYGIFQSGMAYRYLGQWGRLLAPLSLMCIPVDLIEGFAQVMILSDQSQFVSVKVLATPIKLVLYVSGLVAAVVAIFVALAARRTK